MPRPLDMARKIVTVSLFIALLCGLWSCTSKPSEEQCQQLVDHLIDLEIKAAGTDKLSAEMKADLEKQRKNLKDYLREESVAKCMETLPLPVVECGLQAEDLAARAACEKD